MAAPAAQHSGTFPRFDDGDVLIVISPSRLYHLHRGVLSRCSSTLAALLAKEGPVLSKKAQKNGLVIRYRLVLEEDATDGTYKFRRAELDRDGKTEDGSRISGVDGGLVPAECFRHYDMLFSTFYNIELHFDDTNMSTVLSDAFGLIGTAEDIGTVPTVSKIINEALISQGQNLHRAISSKPLAWIDLAYRLSSKYIFNESLIHAAGRYNEFANTTVDHPRSPPHTEGSKGTFKPRALIDELRLEVREVVDKHANVLKDMCQNAEMRITTHYSPKLMRRSVTGRADADGIGRASYQNDIMGWIALSLFRHFVGQALAGDETHNAPDGGFKFYRQLSQGGQTYLDKETCAGFHEYFPMSQKGQAVLESHLQVIKENVKQFVTPLLRNGSQLDVNTHPVAWLTCLEVKAGEYPWEVPVERVGQAMDSDE